MLIFQVEEMSNVYRKYLKNNKGKDVEFMNLDFSSYGK